MQLAERHSQTENPSANRMRLVLCSAALQQSQQPCCAAHRGSGSAGGKSSGGWRPGASPCGGAWCAQWRQTRAERTPGTCRQQRSGAGLGQCRPAVACLQADGMHRAGCQAARQLTLVSCGLAPSYSQRARHSWWPAAQRQQQCSQQQHGAAEAAASNVKGQPGGHCKELWASPAMRPCPARPHLGCREVRVGIRPEIYDIIVGFFRFVRGGLGKGGKLAWGGRGGGTYANACPTLPCCCC